MCHDGRCPPDFRSAKTVEELKTMDRKSYFTPSATPITTRVFANSVIASTLGGILIAYHLPVHPRLLDARSAREMAGSRLVARAHLVALLEFLGASRIAEHERMQLERYKRHAGADF